MTNDYIVYSIHWLFKLSIDWNSIWIFKSQNIVAKFLWDINLFPILICNIILKKFQWKLNHMRNFTNKKSIFFFVFRVKCTAQCSIWNIPSFIMKKSICTCTMCTILTSIKRNGFTYIWMNWDTHIY